MDTRRWLWLLAALVGVALLLGPAVRWLYPIQHPELVFLEARVNGISPWLVTAVVRVESGWDPRATSRRGARGLMQIMPETGTWLAGKVGVRPFEIGMLYDPVINLRLGAWYLAYLLDEFDGDLVVALAAYNGGSQNVRSWLESQQWTGEHQTLAQIPFPETRRYVTRVLADLERYRLLYGELGLRP